jgi:UDP-N-acetyl-D-glucosamine dehydrogenase
MPEYVVQQLIKALNERGKALKNSPILVIGLSYKKDIDDIRESPSLELLELLKEAGASAAYHDPYVPHMKNTRKYKGLGGLQSVALTPQEIREYDGVIISTDHSSIDYEELVENAQLVIDTRNATKNVANGRQNIVKA